MSKTFQTIIFIAAFTVMLAGLPGIAVAGRVNIDEFKEPQEFLQIVPANTSFSVTQTGLDGVIEGRREIEVKDVVGAVGLERATISITNSNTLAFDMDPGAKAKAILTYNGSAGSGLGDGAGVDLTDGGIADAFALEIESLDIAGGSRITIGVREELNSFQAVSSTVVSKAGKQRLWITFQSFQEPTFSFNSVKEVVLTIEAIIDDTDIKLDSFYTAQVPEPSTIFLFALGGAALYGSALFRKRKAKSTA